MVTIVIKSGSGPKCAKRPYYTLLTPYSQALRIKSICSTKKDFDRHLRELERFLKQGYDQKLVDEQLEKVDKLVRDDLLLEKDQEQQDPKSIPLSILIEPYSSCSQKLEHPPTQQKSTGIIPRTTNHGL